MHALNVDGFTLNGMEELAPIEEFTSKLSALPNKLKK